MIKDILVDILAHTHSLGFINVLKINGDDNTLFIESIDDKKRVILHANSKHPILELKGEYGLASLDKLAFHLKNPEYQDDAKIEIVENVRNGISRPTEIHFENKNGDFQNDYRFISSELINERIVSLPFHGANFNISIQPSMLSIQKLKLQASANSDETFFRLKVENGNLVFYFGNESTHAGSFIFHPDIKNKFKNNDAFWPISEMVSVLNLDGIITLNISDEGLIQVIVDSGIIEYRYHFPALSK